MNCFLSIMRLTRKERYGTSLTDLSSPIIRIHQADREDETREDRVVSILIIYQISKKSAHISQVNCDLMDLIVVRIRVKFNSS